MKKLKDYQKPFLEEYPYFGGVVEGGGTEPPTGGDAGDGRSDNCDVFSGADMQ